jgi:peptide/nickel transport system ATP-binding protein
MIEPENNTGQTAASDGVSVSGLTVVTKRRQTPIVDDVSFQIKPGTVMGLVGESGSGKSTVSLALLGHTRRGLKIAAGEVVIDGRDLLALSGPQLRQARGRQASYVPQDPASGLNPGLRVGYQLREAFTIHPDSLAEGQTVEDRTNELLLEVGLPATELLLRSYPHQLSGGQQQRIAIAMAFACRPRLIVLDEPTTGLDVSTQRHVLDTVRELTRRHDVTAVYVSHDLAVVAQIADQTAVMYAGRVVEKGPTDRIFRSARHHYTAGLIKAAPSARQSSILVGIEGRPPRPGNWPPGCSYAARCASAADDCRRALPALEPASSGQLVRCFHPLPELAASAAKRGVPAVTTHPGQSLSVRDLSASYGTTEVLHGISFEVPPGSCTAIVGESGSGKTTLARCVVGMHRSWQGEVTYGGATLDRRPERRTKDQRRIIQYIFQNPYNSLNPRMSVGDNMEEPLRYFTSSTRQERRAQVIRVLDAVALSAEFIDRMPDELSGGERQRVAVGRALTVDPELLVCDEITSALDVSVQALLVEQLRHLQHDRSLSMLFITHNLAVVRSIAQDVIVISKGHVVERGPVDLVLDHPQHDYTRQLLADLPHLEEAAHSS